MNRLEAVQTAPRLPVQLVAARGAEMRRSDLNAPLSCTFRPAQGGLAARRVELVALGRDAHATAEQLTAELTSQLGIEATTQPGLLDEPVDVRLWLIGKDVHEADVELLQQQLFRMPDAAGPTDFLELAWVLATPMEMTLRDGPRQAVLALGASRVGTVFLRGQGHQAWRECVESLKTPITSALDSQPLALDPWDLREFFRGARCTAQVLPEPVGAHAPERGDLPAAVAGIRKARGVLVEVRCTAGLRPATLDRIVGRVRDSANEATRIVLCVTRLADQPLARAESGWVVLTVAQ